MYYIIPILFLTLFPSIWKRELRYNKSGFIAIQVLRLMLGFLYLLFLHYIIVLDHNILGIINWNIAPVIILMFIDSTIYNKKFASYITIPIIITIFLILLLLVYPTTIINDKYKVVKEHIVIKNGKLENMNIEHVVVVPRGYAVKKSQQLIGRLKNPSYYRLGEMSLQKIKQEIYWVAPLEYAGFFKALKGEPVPGYIKVSAENRDSNAEIVKIEMNYVPTAVFRDRMERQVRNKYPKKIFLGTSFEPDDKNKGKPYYVISYGHYSHLRKIPHIDGVIVFDPQNAEMKDYTLENVPRFVDQVYPAWIAEDYNYYFGKYKYGFWASLLGNKGDLHEPTEWGSGDNVVGVFGQDNQMYWFTDHTTLNKSDTSMVGYSMMNSRTGSLMYYNGASGFKNGKEALQNVNNTFRKEVWRGTQPKLYGIYGHDTWVIPVVDPDNEFREIALVHAESGKVVHAESKERVYNIYKRELAMQNIKSNIIPTDNSNIKTLTGVVKRALIQNNILKFIIEEDERIFVVDTDRLPYSIFTTKGDIIKIAYFDTDENSVNVFNYKNKTLMIH